MLLRKLISPKTVNLIKNSMPVRLFYRFSILNPIYSVNCEVTTRCNLNCRMCSRTNWVKGDNFKSEDIPDLVLSRTLKETEALFKAGKKIVFMTNGLGEPLLYAGLMDLAGRVKKISGRIKFSFTTNAVALSEKMAERLIKNGVDAIIISMNAANRESYNDLMGADLYDKVIENVKNLLNIRKKFKSRTPALHIQLMKTKNTAPYLTKGVMFWKDRIGGQDKVFIHEPVTHAGIIDVTDIACCSRPPVRYPCMQCWARLAVRINGDVYPCDAAYYSNEPIKNLLLGNITGQTFSDVYFSKNSRIMEIRKAQRENNYDNLPYCIKCDTFKLVPNVFFKIPNIFGRRRWI